MFGIPVVGITLNNPDFMDEEDTKVHAWLLGFFASVWTSWAACWSSEPERLQQHLGLDSPCGMAQALLSPSRFLTPPSPVQSQDRAVERICVCEGCHRIHSTELVPLGFPVCHWVFFLGSWKPRLWLSQQLCVAGNPSQVQKWHCFPSKEQMLPALLCCSNLWGWQTVLAAQGDCLK